MRENVFSDTDCVRSVSDPVIVDHDDAAEALLRIFLANADANDHDANDYLVVEFCRRSRDSHPVPTNGH
ncbi:hypothetical protein [Actinokineospora inagensis]|uniref:hypothetical protein n=1 Tax=Actinokineospora inagensis TaxID=103730 RepID=UPI00040C18F1|nr:hypothetical protein [Actinokineospora inagensis]